jgi:hypothetical protein
MQGEHIFHIYKYSYNEYHISRDDISSFGLKNIGKKIQI